MTFVRNALLGAAGLVLASLPASAASSTTVGDTVSNAPAKQMQIAQRNENPGGAGFRNENPGGPGFKKKAKKAKKKM